MAVPKENLTIEDVDRLIHLINAWENQYIVTKCLLSQELMRRLKARLIEQRRELLNAEIIPSIYGERS